MGSFFSLAVHVKLGLNMTDYRVFIEKEDLSRAGHLISQHEMGSSSADQTRSCLTCMASLQFCRLLIEGLRVEQCCSSIGRSLSARIAIRQLPQRETL